MSVKRGEIVWLNMRDHGASLEKKRPGVVVQNDIANRFSPHTIVAAIRDDAGKSLPVQVPIAAGTAGLTKDSVADCGFLMTVPVAALEPTGKNLPPSTMAGINVALKRSLAVS